jgi:nucleotide sugar dehydrogenase
MSKAKKPLIGFIGQGWIGKNYADDFETRGYEVIRYSLEPAYAANKEKIAACGIVFIAVPTPTTPHGFDANVLMKVIKLIGKGKIAVIKSTIEIGLTEKIQAENPEIIVLHSPEFLCESTAAHDASHPSRNIIGMPQKNKLYKKSAEIVLSVLPKSPYTLICASNEAELIKYAHNIHGFIQVIFSNLLFDVAAFHNMNWDVLKGAFLADPMMSHTYLNPVHKSGRGAGGHCFIKDMEAFIQQFEKTVKDEKSLKILETIRNKNNHLLLSTGKDLDLLEGIYGRRILDKRKK